MVSKSKPSRPPKATTRTRKGVSSPLAIAVVAVAVGAAVLLHRQSPAAAVPSGDCVVRLHNPTPGEFAAHSSRVVVLTGLSDNHRQRTWTLDGLASSEAGTAPILPQPVFALATSGGSRREGTPTTLSNYAASLRAPNASDEVMGFDRAFFGTAAGKRVLGSLALSGHARVGLDTNAAQLLLSMGGKGHGLPFHYHTASWLELLTGAKRWAPHRRYVGRRGCLLRHGWPPHPDPPLSRADRPSPQPEHALDWKRHLAFAHRAAPRRWWVAPPGTAFPYDNALPISHWVNSELGGDAAAAPPAAVCAFEQRPGETVHLPEAYVHATFNLDPLTIGAARAVARRPPPPPTATATATARIGRHRRSSAASGLAPFARPSRPWRLGRLRQDAQGRAAHSPHDLAFGPGRRGWAGSDAAADAAAEPVGRGERAAAAVAVAVLVPDVQSRDQQPRRARRRGGCRRGATPLPALRRARRRRGQGARHVPGALERRREQSRRRWRWQPRWRRRQPRRWRRRPRRRPRR